MSKTGKMLLGAVLGAAAATLLTPLSGKQARSKVRKTLKQQGVNTDTITSIVESVVKKASKEATSVKKAAAKKAKK